MESYFKNIKINSFLVIFVILVVFCNCNDCFVVKKSATAELNSENLDSGLDKIIVNYDEYPVSVNQK